jgi:cell wall-associated NlpC family hydrolase
VILPAGSSVPELTDGSFRLADNQYAIDDTGSLAKPGEISAEELFPGLVSVPYIWCGRCGYGFDCSGLTQFLCRVNGKELPRDASEQSAVGQTLSFMEETQTGDLAFFDNTEGMIHHVGMMAGKDHIIHASGMVRIDKIDQQGIYNAALGKYTHKLRVLKRV